MPKATLLYYYAHVYLPSIVYANKDAFMATVDKGPEVLRSTLVKTFEQMKADENKDLDEKNIELKPEDFTSIMKKSKDGTSLLLIKFPAPSHTTEVAYAGITLGDELKYYTLELHQPIQLDKDTPRSDKYFFCSWTKNREHHRLKGTFDDPDPELFAQAIGDF